MTGPERGFLLLTSHLGDPARNPLTTAQLRNLASRVRQMNWKDSIRDLDREDLLDLGYDPETAQRILTLMTQEPELERYLQRGREAGCVPICRGGEDYPARLRNALGWDAPGCLWAKGDRSLLEKPAVALVGSRDLRMDSARFAWEAGAQAARQGYVLISGNARGADREAQEACLSRGGQVISVVADSLRNCPDREGVLWLSEDDFDLPFSPRRALSRNRVIHALCLVTLVAQCDLGKGGTWDGTVKNLRNKWSPVFCFADGGEGARELETRGAGKITVAQLRNIANLYE